MTHGADRGDAYVARIREVNPAFDVVDYDDAAAAAYVRENYAGTALPATYDAVAAIGRPVMLADLFRLAVVAKEGGFYLDADVLAKAPLDPLVDEAAVFPLEWWKSDAAFAERHAGAAPRDALEHYQVGNYAFGAEPGHPFVADALDEATARAKAVVDGRKGVWGAVRRFLTQSTDVSDLDVLRTTGPYMLSEVYHGGRLASGKYADVRLLRGDSEKSVVAHGGAADWHKFGGYAEHTLAHSWVTGRRRLDEMYGDLERDGDGEGGFGGGFGGGFDDAFANVCGTNEQCEDVVHLILGVSHTYCDTEPVGMQLTLPTCKECVYPGDHVEGTETCANYVAACCAGGLCDSCSGGGGPDVAQCADSPTWHKEGNTEHDCADVMRRNEASDWKKKKAKKNCKKASEEGVKADKACKCQACDSKRYKKKARKEKTKRGSVVIAVPVCVAGVFLIGGAAWIFRKKKTTKVQRRLSHRQESMPTITPESL
jgi:hypothetical protein